MDGFFWGHNTCIMLLFSGLPLDTPLRWYLGIITTLLLAVFTESLTAARRGPCSAERLGRRMPNVRFAVSIALFAIHTACAYMLMLIAMTYQLELFISVISGLAVGHALFNLRAPVPESADPCCGVDEVVSRSRLAPPQQHAPPHASSTASLTAPLLVDSGHASAASWAPSAVSHHMPTLDGSDGGQSGMCETGTTLTKRRLRVTGMTCASCEGQVRGVLEAVEGVASVQVEFHNGLVDVVCLPTVPLYVLEEAVRSAGKEAASLGQ